MLQGPYDTMLHRCDGLEGGITLRSPTTDAYYMPSSPFLQKLPRTTLLSSNIIGYAVSVQTSTGVVIGCARFENQFPVDATFRGKHVFSQLIQYLPAILPDVSNLDILQYNILEGIAGTCSSSAKLFDPWYPPGLQIGTAITNDQFPVGDLPGHKVTLLNLIFEIPLIGNATILGHVVSTASLVGML